MDVSPTIQHPHGRIRSITGTDPAANTEISETVPARRRWLLRGLFFTLVTDVNVADRQITITIDDGTNILFQFTLSTTQPTSTTYAYSLAHILAAETKVITKVFHSLPPLPLQAGYRIYTYTPAKEAGDNFSAPQLLVEEWIDP